MSILTPREIWKKIDPESTQIWEKLLYHLNISIWPSQFAIKEKTWEIIFCQPMALELLMTSCGRGMKFSISVVKSHWVDHGSDTLIKAEKCPIERNLSATFTTKSLRIKLLAPLHKAVALHFKFDIWLMMNMTDPTSSHLLPLVMINHTRQTIKMSQAHVFQSSPSAQVYKLNSNQIGDGIHKLSIGDKTRNH